MKAPVNVKKVIAAYRMNGSIREAAAVLHMSYWKVREILRAQSFTTKPRGGASHKGKPKSKRRSGSFALWVREHPGQKLPMNLAEISEITGCSRNAIKCSLYRMRKMGRPIPLLRKRRRSTRTE